MGIRFIVGVHALVAEHALHLSHEHFHPRAVSTSARPRYRQATCLGTLTGVPRTFLLFNLPAQVARVEVHAPAFEPLLPHQLIVNAEVLGSLVFRPPSHGQLESILDDVLKASVYKMLFAVKPLVHIRG